MIVGLGNDIIDIRRIEKTLEWFGDRFVERVFTDIERARSNRRVMRAASYAKRYAAKEACSKALGTGFRNGVFWRDIGVLNEPSGRPKLALTGGARDRLLHLVGPDREPVIHLTITDEPPYAQAIVIILATDIGGAHRANLRNDDRLR